MSSSFQDMGNICSPKVKLCMWRVLLDCIPSRANLVARGITLQLHLFPLCELQQESTEHILLHCPIAYSIWCCCLSWLGESFVLPFSVVDHFLQQLGGTCGVSDSKIWNLMMFLVLLSGK